MSPVCQHPLQALPHRYLALARYVRLTIKGTVWSPCSLTLCTFSLFPHPLPSLHVFLAGLPSPLRSAPLLSAPLLSNALNKLYSLLYPSCGSYLRGKGCFSMGPQRHPIPPYHTQLYQTYPQLFYFFHKTQHSLLKMSLWPMGSFSGNETNIVNHRRLRGMLYCDNICCSQNQISG